MSSRPLGTSTTAGNTARVWEVDALRAVAFVLMVIYHTAFDLAVFGSWPIPVTSGGWRVFADFIAGLFLFVSGISLVLSRQRWGRDPRQYRRRVLRRIARLGLAAALVTLATWAVSPPDVVLFGILHLILVSSIAAQPLLRFGAWNLVLAIAVWALGSVVAHLPGDPRLFWLGLVPDNYRSFDFRPFLPWFAFVLLGAAFASWFYAGRRPVDRLASWEHHPVIRALVTVGRHSLVLYLAHQPVLIALLGVLGLIDVHGLVG